MKRKHLGTDLRGKTSRRLFRAQEGHSGFAKKRLGWVLRTGCEFPMYVGGCGDGKDQHVCLAEEASKITKVGWAGSGPPVEGGGTSCPGGRGTSSLLGVSQDLGQGQGQGQGW